MPFNLSQTCSEHRQRQSGNEAPSGGEGRALSDLSVVPKTPDSGSLICQWEA